MATLVYSRDIQVDNQTLEKMVRKFYSIPENFVIRVHGSETLTVKVMGEKTIKEGNGAEAQVGAFMSSIGHSE